MSNFYIVSIGGSQQKVSIGDEIVVDKVDAEEGKSIEVSDILLSSVEDKITVGKPGIAKLKATFEVVNHFKGDKLYVRKFRAKSRYARKTGFRANLTTLKLIEVK